MRKMLLSFTILTVWLVGLGIALPAFPGAEGYGAASIGGRGGQVIEVTNLSDAGTGSLRAACAVSGARTVVFRVGGTIITNGIRITNPYITIAGQTAPGGGICLKLSSTPAYDDACISLSGGVHDVIIRNIRFRSGPSGDSRSFGVYGASKVIIDHCSMSWGVDGNFDFWYANDHITAQYCITSEALMNSVHSKNEPHSMGMLLGSADLGAGCADYISIHHNLFAHNNARNPRVQGNQYLQVINNLIYDYGGATSVMDDGESLTGPQYAKADYISNYCKAGLSSNEYNGLDVTGCSNSARIYVQGNIANSRPDLTQPEWNYVDGSSSLQASAPLCTGLTHPVTITPYPGFMDPLLANVGAIIPLDPVDTRIVNDARNGTGRIIDDPSEVDGWPALTAGTAPMDTDHDGMPDAWEQAHGLNPDDTSDRNGTSVSPEGYTNLEAYLNGLFDGGITAVRNAGLKAASVSGLTVESISNSRMFIRITGEYELGSSIRVYDYQGKMVADLKGRFRNNRTVWDAARQAGGVYVVIFRNREVGLKQKIVLVK